MGLDDLSLRQRLKFFVVTTQSQDPIPGKVYGWLQRKTFTQKKHRHLLFLKIRKLRLQNLRNTIFKEKCQL